jgi:hypothetical protein
MTVDEREHKPGPHREPTPRWVKLAGVVAAAVVTLLLAGLLLGKGNHGPNRHNSGKENTAEQVPTHKPPKGDHG